MSPSIRRMLSAFAALLLLMLAGTLGYLWVIEELVLSRPQSQIVCTRAVA